MLQGCDFLGDDPDLILGAMSNNNVGLTSDMYGDMHKPLIEGCTPKGDPEFYCFQGFDDIGHAIPVECSTCLDSRRRMTTEDAKAARAKMGLKMP